MWRGGVWTRIACEVINSLHTSIVPKMTCKPCWWKFGSWIVCGKLQRRGNLHRKSYRQRWWPNRRLWSNLRWVKLLWCMAWPSEALDKGLENVPRLISSLDRMQSRLLSHTLFDQTKSILSGDVSQVVAWNEFSTQSNLRSIAYMCKDVYKRRNRTKNKCELN